jgi:hypothetical protein
LEGFGLIEGFIESTEKNDRNGLNLGPSLQQPTDFITIHAGHKNIEEKQIWRGISGDFSG